MSSLLLRVYSCCLGLQTGTAAQHHVIQTSIPLGAALIQVRGAKRRFGGNQTDPFTYKRRKDRIRLRRKFLKVPLMSDDAKMKEIDLPIRVTSLNQVLTNVLPLEKFAKAPIFTALGMRQRLTTVKAFASDTYAGAIIKRKLRKVDKFRPIEFARKAQEQYIKVNQALKDRDKYALNELVTENASKNLRAQFLHKDFKWSFVEELERPRVVSARVAAQNSRDDLYAQLTVRMKSKQIIAIYNAKGEVVQGDPHTPKEIIDYVVFERHLVDPENTRWRVLSKLPPQVPWKTTLSALEAEKRGQVGQGQAGQQKTLTA